MKCIINWTEISTESGAKFVQQAKPITDEEYDQLTTCSEEQRIEFIRIKFHGNPMEIVTPTIQKFETEENRTAFLRNFPQSI